MRSGFNSRQGIHDLVACSYTLAIRLGLLVEAYDLSLMSLCLLCLGFGSFSRLQYDFILHTALAYYAFKGSKSSVFHSWDVLGELLKSARVWVWVLVPFTLLARLNIFGDETRGISLIKSDQQVFGVSIHVRLPCPPTLTRFTTMTNVACGQTSQEMPTIQWTKLSP